SCDLAYSIMETPFRRDVVKELCDAAHKRGIKIDLYFSHPDWYDADFRPYVYHPLQVPSSLQLTSAKEMEEAKKLLGDRWMTVPDPTPEQAARMMARHRAQLVELFTNYGTIDMVCLDMWLGRSHWPELRKTILQLRQLQPHVMLRDRGIGNYGDYYTPERVVPSDKQAADAPWFVIYPLGTDFSYEPDAAKHKGTAWIVHNLVDSVAKGGGFMVGVGPNANGEFHPEAQRELRATGDWLKINGEGIYNTRPRDGTLWSEGETIRYTRTKDRRWVYAFSLQWPGKDLLLTRVKPRSGSDVHLLGFSEPLRWKYDSNRGLTVSLPDNLQKAAHWPGQFAWAFKIETENG
ncbi:MAG TPA: alpha-L-fucosidase, partial [Terriglobales bacterium]|nr:alpha-L-fucosidase [Terriglobales bacterium]